MKQLIILFFILTYGSVSSLYATPIESQQENTQELGNVDRTPSTHENAPEKSNSQMDEEPEESTDEREIESDSSYYSVNKFNIILYYVYKLKYGEDDTPTEE